MTFLHRLFKPSREGRSALPSDDWPIDTDTHTHSVDHKEQFWFAEGRSTGPRGADGLKALTARRSKMDSTGLCAHSLSNDFQFFSPTSEASDVPKTGNIAFLNVQPPRTSSEHASIPAEIIPRVTMTASRPVMRGYMRPHEITSPRLHYQLCAWLQKTPSPPLNSHGLGASRWHALAPEPLRNEYFSNPSGLWSMFGPDDDYFANATLFENSMSPWAYEGLKFTNEFQAQHLGHNISNSSSVSEYSETASFVPSDLSSVASTDSSVVSVDYNKLVNARTDHSFRISHLEKLRGEHSRRLSSTPSAPCRKTNSLMLKLDLSAPNRYSGSKMSGPYPTFGCTNYTGNDQRRKRTSLVIPLAVPSSDVQSIVSMSTDPSDHLVL